MNTVSKCLAVILLPLCLHSSYALADETPTKPLKIMGVDNDEFSQEITIRGSLDSVNPLNGISREWFIRSWINKKTGNINDQLYVYISYVGEWKHFLMAADNQANTLPVTQIDSHVGDCSPLGCILSETIGVELTEAQLKDHSATGYRIKLTAKTGEGLIITISPEQIQAQLLAIAQYTGIKKTKAVLGVDFVSLQPSLATAVDRPGLTGVLVVNVKKSSVAEKAGIQNGDILYAIDGSNVTGAKDFQSRIAHIEPGAKAVIKAIRGKADVTLDAQF